MQNNLLIPKIDSFKIRFPLGFVKIIDNSFNSEYQKIYIDTGEIEEQINLDKHKVSLVNGISFRCGQAHYKAGADAIDCIYMQVNAKMLGKDYFKGITKQTIKQVWQYIVSLKIVDISLEAFMAGMVSDVDICYDFSAEPKQLQKANYIIYKNVLPSKYQYVSKPFARKDNTGLQFNARAKATPSRPYIKIYHKTLELENKSTEFADAFLRDIDFKNVARIEYTIKNSRHKKHLRIKYNTLEELLNLRPDQMLDIIKSGIPLYVTKMITMKDKSTLGPKDALLHYFLELLIQKGSDKYQIYQALNMFEDEPVKKHRMKKLLDNLIHNVDDQNRLITNAESMAILRQLDLDFLG